MASWQDIDEELNAWSNAGRMAQFWWRDDDASQVTPALDRLVNLSNRYRIPLVLAVIPSRLQADLPQRLNAEAGVSVIQHGFSHQNHAPAGKKSSEYPASRDIGEMIADVADGWSRLSSFKYLEKAFVPPWNRIAEAVSGNLAERGYLGVSTFGPRTNSGRTFVNTHVDIIDWRGHRGFVGEDKALDQVLKHLRNKRLGHCDTDEPTGLLTHHLDHDEDCWNYLETFFDWTRNRHAIEWLSAKQVFGRPKAGVPYG